MDKRLIIITYYWPPSGGSGVQRWLKFVKYLCKQGWEPWIFTPENPSFTIRDESLMKDMPLQAEVIKLPIWEPYQAFFRVMKFFGRKPTGQTDFVSTQRPGFLQRVSTWVRGNLFIPDARKFWIKPSVAFLSDLIATNQIDKIITTGPPHSIHLIGLRLKKKYPHIKWVADFRDPWSEWDLLDSLLLTHWARRKHQVLERDVLTMADRVITIAPYHVKRLEMRGNRKVDLITNGFDPDDFAQIQPIRTDKFTIRHIGIVDELRDPKSMMLALNNLLEDRPELASDFKVEFVGNVNSAFKTWVASKPTLSQITGFVSYVPHSELPALFAQTDLQLLVLARTALAPGNLPGKFFEYLASGKPILAIGPTVGDAASILHETEAGQIFEHENLQGIKQFLSDQFQAWARGEIKRTQGSLRYSREQLTAQLIKLLKSL